MEHMEVDVSLMKFDNCEEIEGATIELSEAEVEEVAQSAGVVTVESVLLSATNDVSSINSQDILQHHVLTSVDHGESAAMILDADSKDCCPTFVGLSDVTCKEENQVVLVQLDKHDVFPTNTDISQPLEYTFEKSCSGKHSDSKGNPSGITLPFAFPGQSFNEQAQKLILNVWDFFKRAKKDPNLVYNLRGPQDHAAAALNVGTKTIGKIAKRVLRLGKLETPGKRRNRPKTVLDSVGAEGEEVLRNIIREMYNRRVAPTIPLVLAEAKMRINFKGSTTSLRRILKRMGYKYGGIDNTLIQSDKLNVSGWKEKSSKKGKPWRQSQKKNRTPKKPEKENLSAQEVVEPTVPRIVETDNIIQSHEICHENLHSIQPHEVIIHYQKPDEAYLSQAGQNQIITVTTDPSQLIQLQLDSNGETVPVTVVQEWQWQSLQKLDDVL